MSKVDIDGIVRRLWTLEEVEGERPQELSRRLGGSSRHFNAANKQHMDVCKHVWDANVGIERQVRALSSCRQPMGIPILLTGAMMIHGNITGMQSSVEKQRWIYMYVYIIVVRCPRDEERTRREGAWVVDSWRAAAKVKRTNEPTDESTNQRTNERVYRS